MKTEQELEDEIEEFQQKANDILEAFLESLHPVYTIDIRDIGVEDENYSLKEDVGFSFIYTDRGGTLGRRMIDRLYKVEHAKYPDEMLDIESHLFREP